MNSEHSGVNYHFFSCLFVQDGLRLAPIPLMNNFTCIQGVSTIIFVLIEKRLNKLLCVCKVSLEEKASQLLNYIFSVLNLHYLMNLTFESW